MSPKTCHQFQSNVDCKYKDKDSRKIFNFLLAHDLFPYVNGYVVYRLMIKMHVSVSLQMCQYCLNIILKLNTVFGTGTLRSPTGVQLDLETMFATYANVHRNYKKHLELKCLKRLIKSYKRHVKKFCLKNVFTKNLGSSYDRFTVCLSMEISYKYSRINMCLFIVTKILICKSNKGFNAKWKVV